MASERSRSYQSERERKQGEGADHGLVELFQKKSRLVLATGE